MRGEQDTPIMGKDATLQDNIDLLRDVLKTQNELIRRHVNPEPTAVQRLFVLFTEVEAFYYGDAQTPGLMGNPEKPSLTYPSPPRSPATTSLPSTSRPLTPPPWSI